MTQNNSKSAPGNPPSGNGGVLTTNIAPLMNTQNINKVDNISASISPYFSHSNYPDNFLDPSHSSSPESFTEPAVEEREGASVNARELVLNNESDEVLEEIYGKFLEGWDEMGMLASLVGEELLVRYLQRNFPETITRIVLRKDFNDPPSYEKTFQIFNQKNEIMFEGTTSTGLKVFENYEEIEDMLEELYELVGKLFIHNVEGETVYNIIVHPRNSAPR